MPVSIERPRISRAALIIVLALCGANAPVSAQTKGTISGVVYDQGTKLGMEGAEVRIIGTAMRTTSGTNGRYEFSRVEPGLYELEARRVGYTPYRDDNVSVQAGAVTKAHLVLRPIAPVMDNVVTTASSVGSQDLTIPVHDAAQAVQGKVAGVSVTGSGLPGTEMMIQLRAATSIRGANRPLIIVDGVTLATSESSTLDLSTMDIRSFEILKGPSAAAAYGARGAGGVIIIRTNRGKP